MANAPALHVSSGGATEKIKIDNMNYFITNFAKSKKFQVFTSCGFLQHPDSKSGACIDNDEDKFYIGLPIKEVHESKYLSCDTSCDDKYNSTCLKLNVICSDLGSLSIYFWYLIAVASFCMVLLLLCSVYFYRKLK